MKLTVLGSGSSIPHPKRSSSGYWVESENGSLLLDCGPSVPLRMAQEGLDWVNLDAIWISHFHLDHCGGLAPFLAGVKHAKPAKARAKPLTIFGPSGVKALIEAFNSVNNYKLIEQPFPLEIIEVELLEKFEIISGLEAVAMSTPHTDESCAIHLRESSGKTLVYTADTSFTETLATFGRKADLFILECTFLKDKPAKKHLELSEAMHLIRKAEPKRAMLTHLYPEWDELDFHKEVGKFQPMCEVVEAADGLNIEI